MIASCTLRCSTDPSHLKKEMKQDTSMFEAISCFVHEKMKVRLPGNNETLFTVWKRFAGCWIFYPVVIGQDFEQVLAYPWGKGCVQKIEKSNEKLEEAGRGPSTRNRSCLPESGERVPGAP